jgi:hypothetical protein
LPVPTARQDGLLGSDERVESVADHDAEVLQPHLVDALVDGRDELDERDDLSVEDFERLVGNDQGDRAAVPEVLAIGDGMAFNETPHLDVLIPLGDSVREVAEWVWGDVDAARRQPVSLLRGECAVVPDDVLDRIWHQSSPRVAQVVDGTPGSPSAPR